MVYNWPQRLIRPDVADGSIVTLPVSRRTPVFPQLRTCRCTAATDAMCQYQKSGTSFDHLVGAHEQR
jgi:hypothetical protein